MENQLYYIRTEYRPETSESVTRAIPAQANTADSDTLCIITPTFRQRLAEAVSHNEVLTAPVIQLSAALTREKCYRAAADEEVDNLNEDLKLLSEDRAMQQMLGEPAAEVVEQRDLAYQEVDFLKRRVARLEGEKAYIAETMRDNREFHLHVEGLAQHVTEQFGQEKRAHTETIKALRETRDESNKLKTVVESFRSDVYHLSLDYGHSCSGENRNFGQELIMEMAHVLHLKRELRAAKLRYSCFDGDDEDGARSDMAVCGTVQADSEVSEGEENGVYEGDNEDEESRIPVRRPSLAAKATLLSCSQSKGRSGLCKWTVATVRHRPAHQAMNMSCLLSTSFPLLRST